ncbi:MAG TPA: ATP-dependent DNA ligase, partial [Opitutae bacterium]|nr:ATP-dependent DNA ligase [Opitutae bacterium]
MRLFADLFHDLDSLTKTNERIDRLVRYFQEAPGQDSIWVCWFLSGNRIKGAIKTGELRTFLSDRTGLPLWLVEECHQRVGDLAETVSLLAGGCDTSDGCSLNQVIRNRLMPLKEMDGEGRRSSLFELWDALATGEMLPFHKLLTGGFRMGMSKGNLCKALGRFAQEEPAVIAQRIAGDWSCDDTTFEQIVDPADSGKELLRKPYPFCLASPLQEEVSTLGSAEDWQV